MTPITAPRLLLAPLLILLAVLAAACGSSTSDAGGSASAGSSTSAEGRFPATVQDKFGTTTVESAPKRIVVVGLREQDDVLALGTMPVGTTEWFGEHPGALGPWLRSYVKGRALPKVLKSTDGIDIEAVAALRPDLIIGIYSGMTKAEHETLSKLAPTVGPPKGVVDYGSSWEQELSMTAAAMGKAPEGAAMKQRIDEGFAKARADHPEFAGKTAAVPSAYEGIYVYGPQDSRSRFLTDLGFTFPASLRDIGGEEFGGNLSSERTDLLDLDALLFFTEDPATTAKTKQNPILRRLPVFTEGRTIFMQSDDPVYEQTSKTSVVTMPILLRDLVPRYANAVDGDPSTPTTPGA